MLMRSSDLPKRSTHRSTSTRIAQLIAAGAALVVVGALASTTASCADWFECAASCESQAHVLLRDPANVLGGDPSRSFEVCGASCTTFEVDGAECDVVGSRNGGRCAVTSEGLEIDVPIHDNEKALVRVSVTAGDGKEIFHDAVEVATTEFEKCAMTCHETDVEFSIPG